MGWVSIGKERSFVNLPIQPTPLIGREHQVAALNAILRRADVRLITLTGPGGVGKTRLGLQVAAESIDDFAHGVYVVDLAPIRDAQLLTSAIAATLGAREVGGPPPMATLKDYLRDKQLLLLDNFEQVADETEATDSRGLRFEAIHGHPLDPC